MPTFMKLADRLRAKADEHQKQAEYHQLRAEACRIAIEEIEGGQRERKAAKGESIMEAALAVVDARQAQRKGKGGRPKSLKPTKSSDTHYHTADKVRIRRARSADRLAKFGDTPKTLEEAGIPASEAQSLSRLVAYGYLKKHKSGGFIRTAKPFALDKPQAHSNGTHA